MHPRATTTDTLRRAAARQLLCAAPMLRTRPVWMRGLRVYRALASPTLISTLECADELLDTRVHARSRFRSQEDPSRFAIYTVHDAEAWAPPTPEREPGGHTLIVVREFRRVPL